jgi:peptidoglycan/LPS O-acetylase OafA/YrhL
MDLNRSRIEYLDIFRSLSILLVILFHFFSRWNQPTSSLNMFYPYGDKFNYFTLGRLGVHFFFMISGFVIFMTLEKTHSFKQFWSNRLVRLLPSMILISLFTFILFKILGDSYLNYSANTNIKYLITSITLFSPEFYNLFGIKTAFINGSYWSLWTEVQFYFLISMIYFLTPEKLKFNVILIILFLLLLLNYILNRDNLHYFIKSGIILNVQAIFKESIRIFDIFFYLTHFTSGIVWYYIYKSEFKPIFNFTTLLCFFIIVFQIYSGVSSSGRLVYFAFNILFLLLVLSSKYLSLVSLPFLREIGLSSYVLYLVHEQVGVSLINKIPVNFSIYIQGLIVFIIIISFILFSILFTRKIEVPLINFLKSKIRFRNL